jgi:predicted dehydrogenase
VIGAGVFGRHHATKYQEIPGVELTAIADPSAHARRQAKVQFGVATVADWRALKGQVDLVSICSPASTHAAIVRGFLEAGAHVLVEKPIATTLDEAEELITLAALRGRVLTVGHQERFVFAKSGLLNSEAAPLAIECVRAGPWTGRSTDVGVVLDLMIHDLDLVHNLIPGDPVDVRASGRAVSGAFVDEATANISFGQGSEVTLFASRIADARQRTMRLTYPDGTIEMDFLTRDVRNTTRRVLPPLAMEDPLGESVAAFVASVGGGPDTLVRPEEARRALETALLIEEAVEQGSALGLRTPQGIALIA